MLVGLQCTEQTDGNQCRTIIDHDLNIPAQFPEEDSAAIYNHQTDSLFVKLMSDLVIRKYRKG